MDSPQRDREPEITIDLEEQGSLDLQQHGLDPDDANRRLHEWAQQAAESAAAMRETAPRLQQARSAERVLARASRALNALVAAEEEEACVDAAVDEAQRAAVVAAVEEEVRASTRGVGESGDEEPMGVVAKQKAAKAKALAASLRKWLRIDSNGETSTIGSSKYKLAQRLGVQPRDLRFLELQMQGFSPPALLARENAIVVSFESIRCIITLDYVLVINPEDERVAGLIDDFKSQFRNPSNQAHKRGYPGVSKLSDVASKLRYGRAVIELPFELKALEICFDKMVSELSSAAAELEREALPALEVLTKRIRQPDLEAVRRAKSKLVRLKTRTESIHEVLEKFLNHDEDMHRLNLTAEELSRQASEQEYRQRVRAAEAAAAAAQRAALQKPPASSPSPGAAPTLGGGRSARKAAVAAAANAALPSATKPGGDSLTSSHVSAAGSMDNSAQAANKALSSSSSSRSSSSFNSQDEAEVAEVEMLLEAYDMHLEHALSRLQTLDEYIQDTEDLINTGLDQKRNELITIDILLTSNIVALGLMTTISAIMGMNLVPVEVQGAENAFNYVAIASTCGTYVLYGFFLLWAMRQNLLAF